MPWPHNRGIIIRADGKYQFKYLVNGKPKFVYSWKLEPTDKLPAGKRPCLSLRELEKKILNIDHQLQRTSDMKYVIEKTKTNAGTRKLPMNDDVTECFRRILKAREAPEVEKIIDGHSGFLFLDDSGMPEVAMRWEHRYPDFEAWHDELSRLARAGVKGIKVHPPYQGVDFDDPRYLRILNRAGELGLFVITHAGLDVGLPGAEHSTPEKLLRAVCAVGPVTLVLAHMGSWRCWQAAEEYLPGTGVYLDTSFSLGPMTPLEDGYYTSPADLARLSEADFLRMIRLFGADLILFGTDSPWEDQAAELAKIQRLPLTDAEKQDVLGNNAARLLGIAVNEKNE